MTANVRAQLLAAGAKIPTEKPRVERKPVERPAGPPTPREALPVKKTQEDTTPPISVAATHYVGPYQLQVANGTHFPGRMRAVVVGPASAELTAVLVAALTQFIAMP